MTRAFNEGEVGNDRLSSEPGSSSLKPQALSNSHCVLATAQGEVSVWAPLKSGNHPSVLQGPQVPASRVRGNHFAVKR